MATRVGQVGERIRDVSVRYEGGPTVGVDSEWGPSVLGKWRIVDGPSAGSVLVWKTGRHHATVGDLCKLTATVKKHDTYRGEIQTWVTRGKVEILEKGRW